MWELIARLGLWPVKSSFICHRSSAFCVLSSYLYLPLTKTPAPINRKPSTMDHRLPTTDPQPSTMDHRPSTSHHHPCIATSIAAQIFSEASAKSASVCAAEMKPTSYPLGPKYTPLCNNSWWSILNFSMLAGSI